MSDGEVAGNGEQKWSYAWKILTSLVQTPEPVVVNWRGSGIRAGQLGQMVVKTVGQLREQGVGPGSVVAVLVAPNSPEMLTVRYAVHLLGAALTYVRSTNPGSTVPVLSPAARLRVILDSSAAVLLADVENIDAAEDLSARARGRFTVLQSCGVPAEILTRDLSELGELPEPDPRSLALVSFSSGSTGLPKGVLVSTQVWETTVAATIGLVRESAPRLLVATPLSFVVGPVADAVLGFGGLVVLHEEFDAARAMSAVAEHAITRTFMATSHLYAALAYVKTEKPDLSTLQTLIYTGVAASPRQLEEALTVFGPVLIQVYGSAEAGRISILLPADHSVPELLTSAGRPFPEIEVAVHDQVSGESLAPGQVGEILVRSPMLMDGYLGDPASTSRVLRGGWYHTGDIGTVNEQGYLFLLDRVADVVKTDGVKIYPSVVEREIAMLTGVATVAVYGVRDPSNLEHLHAAVTLQPGAVLDAQVIRQRVASLLSPVHAPEEIRFLPEMPLGVSGKPDKNRLRQLFPVS